MCVRVCVCEMQFDRRNRRRIDREDDVNEYFFLEIRRLYSILERNKRSLESAEERRAFHERTLELTNLSEQEKREVELALHEARTRCRMFSDWINVSTRQMCNTILEWVLHNRDVLAP